MGSNPIQPTIITAHLIADGESYGPNLRRLQDYLNTQCTYTDKILNYLKKRQKTIDEDEWIFSISGPDFVTSEDSIMALYWMRLVQDFGDYVVSPRYGWICRDKLDACIEHIEKINKY